MNSDTSGNFLRQWIGVSIVCIVAIVATIVFIGVVASNRKSALLINKIPPPGQAASPAPGISMVVKIGGDSILQTLAMPTFGLESGQSSGFQIPPGPFEAVLEIAFRPGSVHEAYLGAEIAGGSVIIMRDDIVLQSGFGDQAGSRVMTNLPVNLTRSLERITYTFRADDDSPVRFRAIWQPLGASSDELLPVADDPLLHDPILQGMLLAQQRNCAACHRSDNSQLQRLLLVAPAPNLAAIGSRANSSWLRKWLVDPRVINASSIMPTLFQQDAAGGEALEDVIHILMSLAGSPPPSIPTPTPELIAQGRMLYHTVGCVPCHGPFESPGDLFETPPGGGRTGFLAGNYWSLAGLKAKTTYDALADMLLDPLDRYPGGEMPDMALDEQEASAIAAYVLSRNEGQSEDETLASFVAQPKRIARGKVHFSDLGCVNCHRIGMADQALADGLQATPLEKLAADSESQWGGCLAEASMAGSPQFDFSEAQRSHLVAFLESLPRRRSESAPLDELALSISRLRCNACHAYAGHEGPEPGIRTYFTSMASEEFGDEGRFPPSLSDVGANVTTVWMREVLAGHDRARPYLATRMPRFSEFVVASLPEQFMLASGSRVERQPVKSTDPRAVSIGKALIGEQGFNCIRCHALGDRPASEFPGADLVSMPGRLRYEYFRRWIEDPRSVRLDTIMPAFFNSGRSGLTQYYEGRAADQIEAIWTYLNGVGDISPP